MRVLTFDTTLRDGTQGEGITLSVDDKLAIARKLDEFGIDYIEGGWPGSNPKDEEFFVRARELQLRHARLTAFGSTRLARNRVSEDRNVTALIDAGTPTVSVFGKAWDLHVTTALGIGLDENLKLISETVGYLKDHGKEVVFDAEHFFDGYIANPEYALRTLEAAKRAGADVLCLCDTNGGTPSGRLKEIVLSVRSRFHGLIGIHTHNDADLAVANALTAVEAGAGLVQGCMNGYGERCGNANLASIIGNLELKLGHTTVGRDRLADLAPLCNFIAEISHQPLRNDQAFVGRSAFAHKGGVHVSAVLKNPTTYEHIPPESVGNSRRVLVSDLAGRANITYKLQQYGISDRLDDSKRLEILDRIKQMEHEGYELQGAEGTFELLVRTVLNPKLELFEVERIRVMTSRSGDDPVDTTATVSLRVQDTVHSATSNGRGPLHALLLCMRTCLAEFYPQLKDLRLSDYKVCLLDHQRGAAGKVRVLMNWCGHQRQWTTVGVSGNLIEASWNAMLDAMRLELISVLENGSAARPPAEETSVSHRGT